jgi:flagellar hook-associated protein 2
MGMALSGLASGFDWKSIVDQLIEVSRAPQNRMRTEKNTNASKSSAVNDIKGLLSTLKTSISSLATEESLYKKGVTFKDTSTNWKASASKDTPVGDYKFNLLSEATASKLTGASNLVSPLDASTKIYELSVARTIKAGTFMVNGTPITVDTDPTRSPDAMNLQEVIDQFASAGVIATLDEGQIKLHSNNSIALGSPNDTSNFLQAMRLSGSGVLNTGITNNYTIRSGHSSFAATPSGSADIVFPSGHGLKVGDQIAVDLASGEGTGLNSGGTYHVVAVNGNNVQLSSTSGGAAETISSAITSASKFSRLNSLAAPALNVPLGSAGLSAPIDGGDKQFEINGVSINYNKANTSIQDVLDQINKPETGVTAIYDLARGAFSLTNKTTGNVGISVSNDNGGLAAALGLTSSGALVNGSDATFSVNGGGILTSRSNILDETAHGFKGLSVTANKIGEQTLTVAGDYTAAKDSLNDFITKYNAVQNAIEKYTKVTVTGDKVSSAILAGNRELATLSRNLRTMLYQAGGGVTGSVQRLSDLGINFAGIEPTISLTKSSALESKLASSADDIFNYFSTPSDGSAGSGGLIDRLDTLLSSYVSDSGGAAGGLKAQLDSITNQNKSLDKQIEDVERRLASQRSLLESSFIAMERAQSGFQQQSAYLAKTFNSK